jgi:hypothetical protein
MKVYELLTESRGKAITRGQVEELVRSDFSDAYTAAKDGTIIWRGIEATDEYLYYNTTTSRRDNANTQPLVNHILDIHPDWKDIPRRSFSLVASPKTSTAGRYGYVFVVLPKNGTRIAQVESGDFWQAFEMKEFRNANMFERVGALGAIFENIETAIWVAVQKSNVFDDKIKKQATELHNMIVRAADNQSLSLDMIVKYDKFLRELYRIDTFEGDNQMMFNVRKMIQAEYDDTLVSRKQLVNIIMNGFKHEFVKLFSNPKVSVKEMSPSFTFDNEIGEVWFEGEALMIERNAFRGMIQ